MAVEAVLNNVTWCELVCCTCGVPAKTQTFVWATLQRSPRLYPDVITLSPLARSTDVFDFLITGPGCSVKDSFAIVDLAAGGLEVLFEATWFHRPPAPAMATPTGWTVIDSDAEVDAWLLAAGNEVAVPAAALREKAVTVLASEEGGRIVAGAIALRSGSVVGVSNVFGDAAADPMTWRSIAAVLGDAFPGFALVGYEVGESLWPPGKLASKSWGPCVWLEPAFGDAHGHVVLDGVADS